MRRTIVFLAALAAAAVLVPTPAAASFRLQKQLALAPGGELVVDVAGGGVTVTGGADEGATVVVTSRGDEEDVEDLYTFDFSSEPGRVKVVNKRRRGSGWWTWLDWNGGNSLRFEITVPRSTRVDVRSSGGGVEISDLEGNARLRSSGGRVRAEQVSGDVDANSSGGGVDIIEVRGDVEASSSGGGVDVTGVSGDVNASSSGGGVHVDGVAGRVVAESSGGSVSAVLAAGHSAGGDLSSSGGSVRVEIAPGTRLSIDASSSGGSVSCDLPVERQGKVSKTSLRGNLNGGGAALVLRSSGGGIRIGSSRG